MKRCETMFWLVFCSLRRNGAFVFIVTGNCIHCQEIRQHCPAIEVQEEKVDLGFRGLPSVGAKRLLHAGRRRSFKNALVKKKKAAPMCLRKVGDLMSGFCRQNGASLHAFWCLSLSSGYCSSSTTVDHQAAWDSVLCHLGISFGPGCWKSAQFWCTLEKRWFL